MVGAAFQQTVNKLSAELQAQIAAEKKRKERLQLQSQRKLLMRRGSRSTQVSGTTPDLFAQSAAVQRTLLG